MLSAAATDLARALLLHGRAAGDGLVEVPLSVRQIAELSHRSPGTVQALLRQLDSHGVRIDARRRLFDPAALDCDAPSADAPGGEGLGRADRRSVRALAALVQLVASSPDQLDTAAAVAAEVLAAVAARADGHAPTTVGDGRAATGGAARPAREPAERPRGLRGPDRAVSLTESETQSEGKSEDESEGGGVEQRPISSPSSLSGVARHQSPRGGLARPTVKARAATRDREATAELVAPLVRACARLALPGMTNSKLLTERLAPYSDDQVRYAVSRLLLEANAGALRSPVGKLAALAERADPDYFVASPPAVTLPGEEAAVQAEAPVAADPVVVSQSLTAARSRLGR